MNLLKFLSNNWTLIVSSTFYTLFFLVVIPTLISIIIGVPLGILCYKNKKLKFIIKISAVLQTIPSLALLTILVIIGVGIGIKSALVALVIYSILPIIMNTYIGCHSVNQSEIDNSIVMGMTNNQVLKYTVIPIAFPTILSGIKLGMLSCYSCATIAAMIGVRGLGQLILTGLTQMKYYYVISGTVPLIILSVLTDIIFNKIENSYRAKHHMSAKIS